MGGDGITGASHILEIADTIDALGTNESELRQVALLPEEPDYYKEAGNAQTVSNYLRPFSSIY